MNSSISMGLGEGSFQLQTARSPAYRLALSHTLSRSWEVRGTFFRNLLRSRLILSQSMHNSLLHRFRGAYCGAALADAWAVGVQLRTPQDTVFPGAEEVQPLLRLQVTEPLPTWGKAAIATSRALTPCTASPPALPALLPLLGIPPQNPTELAMGLVLVTLPLVLLGHEDEQRWQQLLRPVWQQWEISAAIASLTETSAYLFFHLLRGSFCADAVLKHLLNAPLAQLQPTGHQALLLVRQALQQGRSLALLLQDLKALPPMPAGLPSPLPFSLALYCFLSTPDRFDLGVQRLARIGQSPRLMVALVGAWVGGTGGRASLPPHWLQHLETPQGRSFLETTWGVPSVAILEQHATALMRQWTGISTLDTAEIEHLAIAPPPEFTRIQ